VVASSGGQGGKELAELRGVTVPVKVTGPLDAPRFRADLRAAVGDALKQRAEDKLKERVQDRLRIFSDGEHSSQPAHTLAGPARTS